MWKGRTAEGKIEMNHSPLNQPVQQAIPRARAHYQRVPGGPGRTLVCEWLCSSGSWQAPPGVNVSASELNKTVDASFCRHDSSDSFLAGFRLGGLGLGNSLAKQSSQSMAVRDSQTATSFRPDSSHDTEKELVSVLTLGHVGVWHPKPTNLRCCAAAMNRPAVPKRQLAPE